MKLPTLLCVLIILSLTTPVRSQFKNFNTEKDLWYEGEVIDHSGKRIIGLINYNFVTDQVRIKFPTGEIKTMIPSRTQSFTIFNSIGAQTFQSLPYDVKNFGRHNYTFFKEIYQNEMYAVLSRHELSFTAPNVISESPSAASSNERENQNHNFPNRSNAKELVVETIYFADRKGTIMPIIHAKKSANWTPQFTQKVRYNEKKLKRSSQNKKAKKFKFVNYRDNFKNFFGDDFQAFKSYTETEKLNLRTIDGLVASLSYKRRVQISTNF